MAIIDAQVHIWAADSPQRPWPSAGAGGRTTAVHGASFGADQLIAAMDGSGIDAAVLIPPSWEGERTDLVEAAHLAWPERLAFMARLDLADEPRARAEFARISALPGTLGFRFLLGSDIALDQLPGLDWLWAGIAEAGLSIMAAPRGYFAELAQVARAHPDLRITIDHLGARAYKKGAEAFAGLDRMLELASLPNVAVKASGLPEYSEAPPPHADIGPRVRRVFEAFGPDRLFFGTDLTRQEGGYPALLALFDSFDWLRGEDRRKVMGDALADWLRWDRAPR